MSVAAELQPPETAAAPLSAVVVVSLLHEGAKDNSATRRFRGRPVLTSTLARTLSGVGWDHGITLVCWADQAAAVAEATAGLSGVTRVDAGPRQKSVSIDTVAAALRWSDGWRGGLHATCWFDRGFSARATLSAIEAAGAGAAILVDPSAGLLDGELLSGLLRHAEQNADRWLVFLPAAPGLGAVLLRKEVVEDLVKLGTHPGRALHYLPDHYAHDPIATPAAGPVPVPAARTLRRFTLDSGPQLALLERVTRHLSDEQLARLDAESLVRLVEGDSALAPLPRDLRIELTCRRHTRPLYLPPAPQRGELAPERWRAVLDPLAPAEVDGLSSPVRVTFAGAGDPLLYEGLPELIAHAARNGVPTCVETDLLGVSDARLAELARSPLDVLLVHLPAATAATYAAVMGADRLGEALANLARFLELRGGSGTPIVVPHFTKLRQNLAEMEAWYDHYLKALGSAVVEGPQHFAGAAHALADMAPPTRTTCRRLSSRLQLLSDGTAAQCDLDVEPGPRAVGACTETPVEAIWNSSPALQSLRAAHRAGSYSLNVLCSGCREWHRP